MKLNPAISEPNAGVMGCGTCTLDSILQFSTERSFLFMKQLVNQVLTRISHGFALRDEVNSPVTRLV